VKARNVSSDAGWRAGRLFVHLVAFAVLTLNLGVLLVIVLSSLSDTQFLVFPPRGFTFDWYRSLSDYADSFSYSLRVALLAATLASVLGSLAALALVRGRVRHPSLWTNLLLAPVIVPSVIYAVSVVVVLARLERRSGFWPLVLALAVIGIPFCVRVILSALAAVNWETEAAARTLGAGRWQAWRLVLVPVLAPSLVMSWLFAFIVAFDDVVVSVFLATPRDQTVSARLFLQVEHVTDPSLAAAATAMIGVTLVAAGLIIVVNRLRVRSVASARSGES